MSSALWGGVAARCGGGRRTWGEQQRALAVSNPKCAKSAIMTKKIFFFKNINMGIKKRRILC
jgi:hypothetical protein